MPTSNSQVIYNWAGEVKGVPFQHEEEEKKIPTVDDFTSAMQNAESAMAQKIIQDNAETQRIQNAITNSELVSLEGTATLADVISAVNKINTFLSTQLVDDGSNR